MFMCELTFSFLGVNIYVPIRGSISELSEPQRTKGPRNKARGRCVQLEFRSSLWRGSYLYKVALSHRIGISLCHFGLGTLLYRGKKETSTCKGKRGGRVYRTASCVHNGAGTDVPFSLEFGTRSLVPKNNVNCSKLDII